MKKLKDREIVERTIKGEKEIFGELVKRYSEFVYRRALNLLKDYDAAMDVTQQTFTIAYENLDRLRKPDSFGSWIAGITNNLSRQVRRELESSPASLSELAEIGIEPGDPGADDLGDKERVSALRRAIEGLSYKYREILDLRCTREFSYERIADFLGISMSAVKSRLYHAKKEILKKLKKEGWL